MLKISFRLCHKSLRLLKVHYSCMSTSVQPNEQMYQYFRTNESDPSKQSYEHEGQFYTLKPDIATKLFLLGGFDKEQQLALKTFRETAIMIRKPALEIMGYLKKTDFSKPVNRYILYGFVGTGKTYTLNHLVHYGFNEKFILLYAPQPTDWIQWPEESAPSQFKEKRVDLPIDAAVWLQHFRSQNQALLTELELKTSKKYTWSLREVTEEGEPLTNVIEHGINRIKHASDCAAVLTKEIKIHANAGRCKALVLVDRINTFFEEEFSHLSYPDRSKVRIDEITIARAFKKLLYGDWKNGAIIGIIDKKRVHPFRILPSLEKEKKPYIISHKSDLILDNIKKEGFKVLDPFIPVKVDKYNEKEMESCLDYYIDRQWIQRPQAKTEEGRTEIKFLSGFNPLDTYNIACSL